MAQSNENTACMPCVDAEEPLWTHPETSAWLRIPESTLYALTARGEGPPAYKVGRARRYDPAKVREWLAAQRLGAAV